MAFAKNQTAKQNNKFGNKILNVAMRCLLAVALVIGFTPLSKQQSYAQSAASSEIAAGNENTQGNQGAVSAENSNENVNENVSASQESETAGKNNAGDIASNVQGANAAESVNQTEGLASSDNAYSLSTTNKNVALDETGTKGATLGKNDDGSIYLMSSFTNAKQEIVSITFTNDISGYMGADKQWTAGVNGSKNVLAWANSVDGSKHKYDVYYACDGAYPSLPADSSYLFSSNSAGKGFTNLKAINNLDKVNATDVTDMRGMFMECGLGSVELTSIDISKVVSMQDMFKNCENLTTVSIENTSATTIALESASSMFESCSKLRNVKLSGFNVPSLKTTANMFKGCTEVASSAEALDLTGISGTTALTDMSGMFSGCTGLTAITGLSNLDTSAVTNMAEMFLNCESLMEAKFTGFDTSKVTSMASMFKGCTSLINLRLNSSDTKVFDTSLVEDMSYMFSGCKNLSSIDASHFKGDSLKNAKGMFSSCSSLNNIYDIGKLNTPKLEDMSYMFSDCPELKELDLSGFDTSSVTNMSSVFAGCTKLSDFKLASDEKLNTSKVTDMSNMFCYCSNLTAIDLTKFDISAVTNIGGMFNGCSSLVGIYGLSSLKNTRIQNMKYLFNKCSKLDNLDLSGINTSEVTDMNHLFAGCSSLTTFKFGDGDTALDTSKVTDMSYMFADCTSLPGIDLTKFSTQSVENMSHMFDGCSSFTTVSGIESANTAKVTNMSYMFNDCTNITSLDLSQNTFDTSAVTNMGHMFAGCASLTGFSPSEAMKTNSVTDMSYMFAGCSSLPDIDLSKFSTENVQDMSHMFDGCLNFTEIKGIENANTANVKDMSYLFNDCEKITNLDLSNFTTSNVLNMNHLFSGCSSLVDFTVKAALDTSKVTNMGYMFEGCSSLPSIDISNFSTAAVKNMEHMFDGCTNLEQLDGMTASGIDTSNVTDMAFLFNNCKKLTKLDLSKFNTQNVENMRHLFSGCSALVDFTVSSALVTNKVTDMSYMFQGCAKLGEINLANFSTAAVTDMQHMFDGCSSFKEITGLTNANTSNVTNMECLFKGCSALESLDLSSFNTAAVTDMSGLFNGCTNLKSFTAGSGLDTSKVQDMSDMFKNCSSLVTLPTGALKTAALNDASSMFEGCSSLTTLNLSNFDNSKVPARFMTNMFKDCTALTTLTLGANFSFCGSTGTDRADTGLSNPTPVKVGYGATAWKAQSTLQVYSANEIPNNTAETYVAKTDIPNTYYVKFDGNGAEYGSMQEQTFTYDKAQTLTANAYEHVGFKFLYWSTEQDGTGNKYEDAAEASNITDENEETVTLYAQWESTSKVYTVSFNTNGGSSIDPIKVAEGDVLDKDKIEVPTKQGEMLEGWYTDATCTTPYNFDTPVNNSFTLYAKWETATYTVAFDTMGAGNIPTQYINYPGKAEKPDDPVRTGFTFKGWFTDDKFQDAFDFDKTVESDVTLYACWEVSKYLVQFDTNNGTKIDAQTIVHGSCATKPDDPVRPSSIFLGWYSDKELTKTFDFSTPITADTTIYAKWDAAKYTITYNLDGGTNNADNPAEYTAGEGVKELKEPTRDGYTFVGWYDDAGYRISAIFTTETGNKTFTAKWAHGVTFISNGGTNIASQLIDDGGTVATPETPTKANCVFYNWYTDADFTQVYDFTSPVTNNVVLYAKWESQVERVAGEEARDTAAKIVQEAYPAGTTSDYAILARDDDFMDAMSATGLAGATNAPIVLTERTELSDVALSELQRLKVKTVYIIGGTSAILPAVESALNTAGLQTQRVFGNEAYDTSYECAKKIVELGGSTENVIVASSFSFQDALSMSSYAYKKHAAILIQTYGATSSERSFCDTQLQLLKEGALKDAHLIVAGGTGAVSDASIALTGRDAADATKVTRLWGQDAFDTSLAIAKHFVETGDYEAGTITLASGAEAAKGLDALAGAALAGKKSSPVLLVSANAKMEDENTTAFDGFTEGKKGQIKQAFILGGTYVMPDNTIGQKASSLFE